MEGPNWHFNAGSNDLGPLHSFGQILRKDWPIWWEISGRSAVPVMPVIPILSRFRDVHMFTVDWSFKLPISQGEPAKIGQSLHWIFGGSLETSFLCPTNSHFEVAVALLIFALIRFALKVSKVPWLQGMLQCHLDSQRGQRNFSHVFQTILLNITKFTANAHDRLGVSIGDFLLPWTLNTSQISRAWGLDIFFSEVILVFAFLLTFGHLVQSGESARTLVLQEYIGEEGFWGIFIAIGIVGSWA